MTNECLFGARPAIEGEPNCHFVRSAISITNAKDTTRVPRTSPRLENRSCDHSVASEDRPYVLQRSAKGVSDRAHLKTPAQRRIAISTGVCVRATGGRGTKRALRELHSDQRGRSRILHAPLLFSEGDLKRGRSEVRIRQVSVASNRKKLAEPRLNRERFIGTQDRLMGPSPQQEDKGH